MKIKARIADPAGNITVFVTTPAKRKDYPSIAGLLLAKKELGGEQVGFIERTAQGGLRLEMMGGEFCGNASRSFAYLLCMLAGKQQQELEIEVSGSAVPLKASVDLQKGTSRIDMPLPKEIRMLELETGEAFPMVILEGICHVVVSGKPREESFVERVLERVRRECPCGAWGILFLEGNTMVPAVYVESTASLVWESSCGSGSIAAAVVLAEKEVDGTFSWTLRQPGGEIQAEVCKKGGKILQCTMGGPVRLSEEIEIELEDERLT